MKIGLRNDRGAETDDWLPVTVSGCCSTSGNNHAQASGDITDWLSIAGALRATGIIQKRLPFSPSRACVDSDGTRFTPRGKTRRTKNRTWRTGSWADSPRLQRRFIENETSLQCELLNEVVEYRDTVFVSNKILQLNFKRG